ncbi:ABC transporter permease [Paenibacillus nasutitermitis]|uniref:Sugar ABC transporter permease n=1 Tax=Paenibacillus nasutitermitis TaxID=1652958 RepID=A0A916ZES7_9BACL|nr:ABC transporter permease subunit [Paenibacillus nasutitermitis]GGD90447.1 sugar ABC transporter permease [Paenibacillus nasutitermitis]
MPDTSSARDYRQAYSKPSERYKRFIKYRMLLLMLLPGFIFLIIFNYIPMYGLVLAFKEFKITGGIAESPWVGLKYFNKAFDDAHFYLVVKNTLIISFYKLVFGFPVPILFAVLLNELSSRRFKKWVQTISYLPHFISWVVLSGIFITIFSLEGPINTMLQALGRLPIIFMADEQYFRSILVVTSIYQSFGWGSIIFLAAIAGIDPQLHEAAIMDGAGRFKRMIHITLPMLVPVISIMMILAMGSILDAGFDQIFNMYNSQVLNVSDIIDTYVYRIGLINANYSYSTAVGMFKSVVALILVLSVNRIVKMIGGNEHTLW